MTADHLVVDRPGDVGEVEGGDLLGHLGVEDDLQEQIAQFVAKIAKIAALDRVGDLIGLLDGVGGDGGEGLLAVPGAAAVRGPQAGHDLDEAEDRVSGVVRRRLTHGSGRSRGDIRPHPVGRRISSGEKRAL